MMSAQKPSSLDNFLSKAGVNFPHYLNRIRQWYNFNPRRGLAVLIGLLLSTCCCCFAIYAVAYSVTPQAKATATARLALTQTAALYTPTSTKTGKPTNTPRPSATDRPTRFQAPTSTQPPTQISTETLPPPPPNGFELISITNSASPGGSASASIRTQPGVTCNLTYILPSGRDSTEDGLGVRTASLQGFCTWFWNIRENTTPGAGSIIISAGGQTESYPIEIK